MTPSYFIWNGKDSEQMGLWVSQYPDRVRAEERMTQVAVPSRSGRFYLSEGTAIYEPISIYIRVQCRADIDLEPLNDWLSGEGVLVLGYEPNRCYKARVIQEVDFGKISNDLLEGQIRFECDPFKKAYPTEKKITLTAAGTVENKGTVPAYPVIKITGDGDISLTCNGIPFAITDMDTSVTLDSGARIALDDDGANCLEKTSGTFPVLQRGMNQIGWTGDVTSVEITRNQRWK